MQDLETEGEEAVAKGNIKYYMLPGKFVEKVPLVDL